MKNNIYLSVPASADSAKRQVILHYLEKTFPQHHVYAWNPNRNYRAKDQIEQANILVVHLPGGAFTAQTDEITNGVKSEIQYAINNGIPIYLIYFPIGTGEPKIYTTVIHTNGPKTLRKIESTSGSTSRAIQQISEQLYWEQREHPTILDQAFGRPKEYYVDKVEEARQTFTEEEMHQILGEKYPWNNWWYSS